MSSDEYEPDPTETTPCLVCGEPKPNMTACPNPDCMAGINDQKRGNMTDFDLNLVVLTGRLAAPPEIRQYESSGVRSVRLLVTVRSEDPVRRVDVIPVTAWESDEIHIDDLAELAPGTRVWVAGSVQRRFWSATEGRRGRLEVVADQVGLRDENPTS